MKRADLQTIDPVSPDYVIAHALVQKARGRKPAVSFRGIRNPNKALCRARAEKNRNLLLEFDAIDAAEKLTSTSYKDSSATLAIGIGLFIDANNLKRRVLSSLDDTYSRTTLAEYLRIAKEEGFEIVLEVPFTGHDNKQVKLFVLFNKADGILLCFDTYGGDKVNGGKFYYNWTPNGSWHEAYQFTSSGGFREINGHLIWSGDHDCKEALRAHLAGLRDHGKFVTPWKVQPFLWLLHYMDTKVDGYDYKAITKSRIDQFADKVKQAIRSA